MTFVEQVKLVCQRVEFVGAAATSHCQLEESAEYMSVLRTLLASPVCRGQKSVRIDQIHNRPFIIPKVLVNLYCFLWFRVRNLSEPMNPMRML